MCNTETPINAARTPREKRLEDKSQMNEKKNGMLGLKLVLYWTWSLGHLSSACVVYLVRMSPVHLTNGHGSERH